MSTRETLLAALHTALSVLAGGRVYRSRKEQMPTLPAVVIRPEFEEDTGEMLGVTDTILTVAIEIYARGDIPDQAADATLSDVYAATIASPDLGLGSNVQILPGRSVTWEIEGYDDSGVTLRLRILYRTALGAM
jgi:hypothetical protein